MGCRYYSRLPMSILSDNKYRREKIEIPLVAYSLLNTPIIVCFSVLGPCIETSILKLFMSFVNF